MIFFSRTGNHRVVVTPATFEYVKVGGTDGVKAVPVPGRTIEFRELRGQGGRGGVFPSVEPGKKGFRGMYETDDPEEVQGLLNHRGYGVSFVGMAEGGGLVDPDAQFVPISTKHGKQRWYCTLNGKIFKSTQAMKNYQKSNEFKALLKEKNLEAQDALDTV